MRFFQGVVSALALIASLGICGNADAAITNYVFSSGTADVTATTGATTIASQSLNFNGASATFDVTAGVGTLIDFEFTLAPSQVLTFEPGETYGGLSAVTITNASLIPCDTGTSAVCTSDFAQSFSFLSGVDTYTVFTGPVEVDSTYNGAVDVNFEEATLNGTVNVPLGAFNFTGVSLGILDKAGFPGEANDLVISANINWTGVVFTVPGSASLIGLGFAACLALRGRRALSDARN